MSTFLPPEIISDILSRLPADSLQCFKTVSKSWHALIESPHFIKLHLNRSMASHSSLIGRSQSTLHYLHIDSDSNQVVVPIRAPFNQGERTVLCCSCDGLLLLKHFGTSPTTLILFNSSTGEHRVLPNVPSMDDTIGDQLRVVQEDFSLGYDSTNDDYKVFSILSFRVEAHGEISSEARVYSLKSNSWRRIKEFTCGIPIEQPWGAFVNSSLHMINYEDLTNDKTPRDIVAFDTGIEVLKHLPLPAEFPKKDIFRCSRLVVFEGCLCILLSYVDTDADAYTRVIRTDIWVMKEYGVKESWTKLLSFASLEHYLLLIPLVYSKRNNEVLLNYDDVKLVWYDLSTKNTREFRVNGVPHFLAPNVYVESLVALRNAGECDEMTDHMVKNKRSRVQH